VLGVRLGEPYWKLLDQAAEQGESAMAVETAAFGCHHGTVGGWLLQLWRLPPALVDPVARHHEPLDARYGLDASAVVGIADRLVHAGEPGHSTDAIIAELDGFAPGLLAADDWRALYPDLAGEQQAIAGMFDG
jgi:HD-like signal output (HDOD) protein